MPKRIEEGNRAGEVRADVVEHQVALGQSLTHQREVAVLEVAEPSMKQLAGSAGRTGGVIPLLDEGHPEPPRCGVEGHAASGHAATDDEDVEVVARHPVDMSPALGRVEDGGGRFRVPYHRSHD